MAGGGTQITETYLSGPVSPADVLSFAVMDPYADFGSKTFGELEAAYKTPTELSQSQLNAYKYAYTQGAAGAVAPPAPYPISSHIMASGKGTPFSPITEGLSAVVGSVESVWNPAVPSLWGAAYEKIGWQEGSFATEFMAKHPIYAAGSALGEVLQFALPMKGSIVRAGSKVSKGLEGYLGLTKEARFASMLGEISDPVSRQLLRQEVEGLRISKPAAGLERGVRLDKIIYGPLGEADYPGGQFLKIGYEQSRVPSEIAPKGFQGGGAVKRWASGGLNYDQVLKAFSEPDIITKPGRLTGLERSLIEPMLEPTFSRSVQSPARGVGRLTLGAVGLGMPAKGLVRGSPSMVTRMGEELALRATIAPSYKAKAGGRTAPGLDAGLKAHLDSLLQIAPMQRQRDQPVVSLKTPQAFRTAMGASQLLKASQLQRASFIPDVSPRLPRYFPTRPRHRDESGWLPKMKKGRGSYEERVNPFNPDFLRDLKRLKF